MPRIERGERGVARRRGEEGALVADEQVARRRRARASAARARRPRRRTGRRRRRRRSPAPLDDRAVAGAAAEIAGERVADARAGRGRAANDRRRTGSSRCPACRSRIASRGGRPSPAAPDGGRPPSARSSTVISSAPSTWPSSRMQALTGVIGEPAAARRASTTVQAPQSPSPQPSFVPLAPASSRSQSSSVARGENRSSATSRPRNRKRSAGAA